MEKLSPAVQSIFKVTYWMSYPVLLISFFLPYHVGNIDGIEGSLDHLNSAVPWYYHMLTFMVLLGLPALQYKIGKLLNYEIRDLIVITLLVTVMLTERAWLPLVSDLSALKVPLGLFLFHMGVMLQYLAVMIIGYLNWSKRERPVHHSLLV
ncbi:MAG: hypothetical protein ACXAE3_12100 [Candidatus Kariarchaeaceae archaeon]|jgi:hypothetical protein